MCNLEIGRYAYTEGTAQLFFQLIGAIKSKKFRLPVYDASEETGFISGPDFLNLDRQFYSKVHSSAGTCISFSADRYQTPRTSSL